MSTLSQPELRFHARAVFVDFGDTLMFTNGKPHPTEADQFLITLATALATQENIPISQARRRVLKVSENLSADFPTYTDKLGIDLQEARTAYVNWMSSVWHTDPDAKRALQEFRRQGLKMWPATTNSGFLCGLKLEAVGLKGPFFEELCGGNEVHPLGKTTRSFFAKLLEKADARPEEVVHIGDNHIWDFDLPFNAGIRQVILLDKNLPEPYLQGENGEIYAQSWSVIPDLIAPIKE